MSRGRANPTRCCPLFRRSHSNCATVANTKGLGRVSHLLFCIANGYLLTPEDEFCAIRPCSDETVRKYFSCFSHRSQTSLYGFRQPIVNLCLMIRLLSSELDMILDSYSTRPRIRLDINDKARQLLGQTSSTSSTEPPLTLCAGASRLSRCQARQLGSSTDLDRPRQASTRALRLGSRL